MIKGNWQTIIAFAALLAMSGCNSVDSTPAQAPATAIEPVESPVSTINGVNREESGPIIVREQNNSDMENKTFIGSGNFIDRGVASANNLQASEGEVTLNFESTPISDVVKTILGDILGLNYSIDENVTGNVSMRTTSPIGREALLPTLENLLHMRGAALIKGANFYEILSAAQKLPSGLRPTTSLDAASGAQVVIVPLRYIGAREMNRILDTVKSASSSVVVDEYRNIVMLAGTHSELVNLRETIGIFDVDQLSGMSVGLFRLGNADASTVADELESVFGDHSEGPLAGVIRLTVIERLNALLVVTPQQKYLHDAETWIKRLDHTESLHGTNMYVYYVQNSKAEALAETLTQLFEGRDNRAPKRSLRDQSAALAKPSAVRKSAEKSSGKSPATAAQRPGIPATTSEVGGVTIIADIETNALLVLGSAADYAEIEKAIKKLDVMPMQVLVEASIVEVTLDKELEYGLQWFFKDSHGKFNGTGGLNIPSDGNVAGALKGVISPADFTYAIFDAGGTRAVLNAVAGDSRLNVLSSPSLMVLDNQTATIRVGDQVPIRTSESTNTNSDNFNVTSQIQYRDTGVMLEVTPRVNSGGMVVLELTQRVDDVDQTDTSGIDSPTIIQREITTSVAVQSGETIVLGGLIRENKQQADRGIPFLRDIPVVGAIFSGKQKIVSKTELIVMITPTAVSTSEDARNITDEYRRKMRDVDFSKLN